jgi:deoxyribonuclease-4
MTSVAKNLLFGTAGIPHSASADSTLSGIECISKLKLDCLEIEFVKGVKMGTDTALQVKETALLHNISLSAHAPYYINLNAEEEGKRLVSQERILATARTAEKCGARSVVFHGGYYGKLTPESTYKTISKGIKEVSSILKSERNKVVLRPETMGKRSQFGSLEEIIQLCREVDGILPCLDFSHIYTRNGKANSYLEFHRILRKIEKKLGKRALKNAHLHISGAEFTKKGERKHIDLKESDFRYDDWVQALKDFEVEGIVICESPNLEQDALMLKKLYEE